AAPLCVSVHVVMHQTAISVYGGGRGRHRALGRGALGGTYDGIIGRSIDGIFRRRGTASMLVRRLDLGSRPSAATGHRLDIGPSDQRENRGERPSGGEPHGE